MEKDFYIIRFRTQKRANFWMKEFCEKFKEDIVSVNKNHASVELMDSVYYFWSTRRIQSRLQHKATEYNEDAIYIILDDPERKRYPNFKDEELVSI